MSRWQIRFWKLRRRALIWQQTRASQPRFRAHQRPPAYKTTGPQRPMRLSITSPLGRLKSHVVPRRLVFVGERKCHHRCCTIPARVRPVLKYPASTCSTPPFSFSTIRKFHSSTPTMVHVIEKYAVPHSVSTDFFLLCLRTAAFCQTELKNPVRYMCAVRFPANFLRAAWHPTKPQSKRKS